MLKISVVKLQHTKRFLKINNEEILSVEQLTKKLNDKTNKGVLLEIMTESGRKEFVGFGL